MLRDIQITSERSVEMKFFAGIALLIAGHSSFAAPLTSEQQKDLVVFAAKSMGIRIDSSPMKTQLSEAELHKLVATGLNLNKHLCASITDLRPLKVKSTYEATCIAYRDGTAKKTYVIDGLNGLAFEP
jgi:hypothetical protein